MKLSTLLFVVVAAGPFAMAAPSPRVLDTTIANDNAVRRQWSQPDECEYCDTFFRKCTKSKKSDSDCRARTCKVHVGQCKRCGYCY